jgi:hypothetical protein
MKRITIPLEDEVYSRVTARAKALNTSVSALVNKNLIQWIADKQHSEPTKQPNSEKAQNRP